MCRAVTHRLSIALSFLSIAYASSNPAPVQLDWSSNVYGPDGPWHALNVSFGSPPQHVDLFPGSIYSSIVLSSNLCPSSSKCPGAAGGLYNPNASSSASKPAPSFNPAAGFLGPLPIFRKGYFLTDTVRLANGTVSIPTTGVQLLESVAIDYSPGITNIPVTLGFLSIGGPNIKDPWSGVSDNLPAPYLAYNGITPSSFVGLHVGSVSANIPPSLWFGGYDKSRVIGNVLAQYYNPDGFYGTPFASANLVDIDVVSFANRTGILSKGNSSLASPLTVGINVEAPYMFLPPSVCQAMTQGLPVTYSSQFGLYLWNTSDPEYSKVVQSASYFIFSFAQNSLKINVPLKLLSLTLDSPITSEATQYFPCYPSENNNILGRAFLQAAFLAYNWQPDGKAGAWFMAQAPGPNLKNSAPDVQSTTVFDTSIASSNIDWESTWDGHWTPLPVNTNPSANPGTSTLSGSSTATAPSSANINTTSSKPNLSIGAIVGIVIGVIIFGAVIGVLTFLALRKRFAKRHRDELEQGNADRITEDRKEGMPMTPPGSNWYRHEMSHEPVIPVLHELTAEQVHEMEARSDKDHVHDLSTSGTLESGS